MTGTEIKEQIYAEYAKIKEAEGKLKELREACKHEETFEGNYSWRVGAVNKALICAHCEKMIKILDIP